MNQQQINAIDAFVRTIQEFLDATKQLDAVYEWINDASIAAPDEPALQAEFDWLTVANLAAAKAAVGVLLPQVDTQRVALNKVRKSI